jgi:ribulose-5-phosphate 4-epimerase/fuculose-1-phosphate aldolase
MTNYWQSAARAAKELPMSEAEREARVELAACYRIFHHLGWTEMIFNHITLRVPGPERLFLINPFGLHYSEVKASNLVLVDSQGGVVRPSEWPINRAGFVIHAAIHGAIEEAHCVMHTHTTTGMAVACLKEGLSYTNFYSAQLYGRVAYHDFEGITVELEEQQRLVRDIGDKPAAILRNHGLLAWGANIPQAFMLLWTLQRACDVQISSSSAGELQPIDIKVFEQTVREAGPSEQRLCEDVFNAMRRLVDAKDPSYRD